MFILFISGRQITIDGEFCTIGEIQLLGRVSRFFFELRPTNLTWRKMFFLCHSIKVKQFTQNGMIYPSGPIYYSQKSSPAFVSFTTTITNVNEKRSGNATVKREGEKVRAVSRQLQYGPGSVSDHNNEVGGGGKLSDKLSKFFTPTEENQRSRKQPDLLLSPTKKDDEIDNITPPDPEDATTCTMFFHDDDRYLLGLLVDTVETKASASQPRTRKLILVTDKHISCYLNFYESNMPQTTQCKSRLDKKRVGPTNPNSINVLPNCSLFRYPVIPCGSIIETFKISCQEFKPIQSLQDATTADLQINSDQSMYQIPKGCITGRDFDGTKSNGWFGYKLIELYLTWLLHTCDRKINNKFSKSIMILPYSIFREFEEINDNKNDQCATSLYDDLVEIQKRNIFDASLVIIFIYREFCWSLAVLVDFDKCDIEGIDKHSKRPSVFYFALRTFTKDIDPKIKMNDKHADMYMEKKIKSFVDSCWDKRLSYFAENHDQPESYPIESYSMIPSLSSEATGKHTKPKFKSAL